MGKAMKDPGEIVFDAFEAEMYQPQERRLWSHVPPARRAIFARIEARLGIGASPFAVDAWPNPDEVA